MGAAAAIAFTLFAIIAGATFLQRWVAARRARAREAA
jgi:ABC-type sugar transport system permease subunit